MSDKLLCIILQTLIAVALLGAVEVDFVYYRGVTIT
jgi:hypothetical protein